MNAACTIDSIKFPKYICEILSRSKASDCPYTIEVFKRTSYSYASSLKKDCEKLVAWANREVPHEDDCPIASIVSIPNKTHHHQQRAYVTIYDPVMFRIEKLKLLKGEINK